VETPKRHRTLDELRADPATAERADTLLARLTALMRERDIPGDPEAEREASPASRNGLSFPGPIDLEAPATRQDSKTGSAAKRGAALDI
jgi:hypothetical protein